MAVTTAAAIGLGLTAATTTASFAQMSKQKKKQKEAEAKASEAMAEARKKLEVNFYEKLGINREPYELERDAFTGLATGALQAGVESERGAGAVAGRVLMSQNDAQAGIRTAMGNEIQDLNRLVAYEDARLNQQKVNLDLGTVEGAQLAARNSEMLSNKAMQQGFAGVTSLAGQIAKLPALYPNTNMPATSTTPQTMTSAPDQQATFGTLSDADYFKSFTEGTLDPKYIVNGEPMPYEQYLQLSSQPQSPDYYKSLFPSTYAALPK